MSERLCLPVVAALVIANASAHGQTSTNLFETHIRPVLAQRCYPCHSAAKTAAPQGGLALDSAAGIRKGGNSGAAITPGDPDASLLIKAIRRTEKKLSMPPGPNGLDAENVAQFEAWVKAGAPMPEDRPVQAAAGAQLWSLQKPARHTPPQVQKPALIRNDIDRFVLAKLEGKGLSFAPEADRRTLIRRATLDLIGLPPTAAEIEGFSQDTRADAYERLIDRLLASPHYGERWGRHWLDVARYADSVNDSVNAGQRYAFSYTYRDWVVQSLNEDLPYDKFLLYQLAADKLVAPRGKLDPKHLAALGFLSLGRDFPNSYPETVDDRIDAVTRGMLGLTVSCARCHDHKFDPIPTRDYYSLYSVFSNIREPRTLPSLNQQVAKADPKQDMYTKRLARIHEAEQEYRERRHREMIAFFRTQSPQYVQAARDADKLSNTEVEEVVRDRQLNLYMLRRWQKVLKGGVSPTPEIEAAALDVPLADFDEITTEGDRNNLRSIRVRYGAMLAQAAYDRLDPRAMAVEDVPNPQPVHVFLRGNPNNPGAPAPPRFLSCLGATEDQRFTDGSGRLELARAIVDPSNPLTARVIVNRVWMHHFGQGLVRTPSDFGFRGDAPTHPELLDTLAVRLRDDYKWSLKQLHRVIMLSAAYRQRSADRAEARGVDPENQLLWRMNRRRLDIEAVRDSMLSAAGRLDLSLGGLPFPLNAEPSVPRRSVYGFIERGRLPGFLNTFDFASPDGHAPMRYVTTVPQQALFYLNSPFVAEQARHVAERAPTVPAMYKVIFGRDPDAAELAAGNKFLSATDSPATTNAGGVWQYGTLDRSGKLLPFPTWAGDRWQGAPIVPAPVHGKANLRAAGGEPGETEPVVRRWTSPVSGRISIEGTLRHGQPAVPYGDGVRGRIVSSRHGELASYNVNGSSAETRLNGILIEAGDTLDFIVDSRMDVENDGFGWSPVIRLGDKSWNAGEEFAGPAAKPLTRRERYAQVLLQTNEFAFVD